MQFSNRYLSAPSQHWITLEQVNKDRLGLELHCPGVFMLNFEQNCVLVLLPPTLAGKRLK